MDFVNGVQFAKFLLTNIYEGNEDLPADSPRHLLHHK